MPTHELKGEAEEDVGDGDQRRRRGCSDGGAWRAAAAVWRGLGAGVLEALVCPLCVGDMDPGYPHSTS